MDTLSRARRSENMRRIRSKGTSPEMTVRSVTHRLGFRFRLHVASLPGKPDLVFVRHRKIIEVHGCFWHRHKGCIDSHIPKTRQEYWKPKLARNQMRGRRNHAELEKLGWKVLVIWECEVRDSPKLATRIKRFLS